MAVSLEQKSFLPCMECILGSLAWSESKLKKVVYFKMIWMSLIIKKDCFNRNFYNSFDFSCLLENILFKRLWCLEGKLLFALTWNFSGKMLGFDKRPLLQFFILMKSSCQIFADHFLQVARNYAKNAKSSIINFSYKLSLKFGTEHLS